MFSLHENEPNPVISATDLSVEGEGIGKSHQGQVCFVPGLLPDEKGEIEILKSAPNYATGRLLRILKASDDRVTPFCTKFEICGGCQIQHLDYAAQLIWKRQHVQETLARIGKINTTVLPVIGATHPTEFRNKAQFPVGQDPKGHLQIGFYAPRSHHLVNIPSCPISTPQINEILNQLRYHINAHDISIYNETTHTGLLRHLVLKYSEHEQKTWVTLVCTKTKLPPAFLKDLENLPHLGGLFLNFNPNLGNAILGRETRHLAGNETFKETIDTLTFEFSPTAFIQSNWSQAKILYQKAIEYAQIKPTDTVWDLYCGVGILGIMASFQAQTVLGLESNPEVIANAKTNALLNQSNAVFEAHNLDQPLSESLSKAFPPDIVLLDPPRKGCSEKLIRNLINLNPRQIIYISCNPSTLARDLNILCQNGFSVQTVQPLDLFPHTTHVECIAKLHAS